MCGAERPYLFNLKTIKFENMDCNKFDKRTKKYKECVKDLEVNDAVELKNTSEAGDVVEKVLKSVGIDKVVKAVSGEDCGCSERKEWLNAQSLMRNLIQYDCMTKEESDFVNSINLSGKLEKSDVDFLFSIYGKVFNVNVSKLCMNCGGTGKKLVRFIKQLRRTELK